MIEEKTSLEKALIGSISSRKINDLGAPLLEIALDSTLDNGPLRDIPVFGTLLRTYDVVLEIKNRFYLKKIAKFLFSLSSVEQTVRDDFVRSLETDSEERTRFGESILLLLDRADEIPKAAILGNLIGAHIQGLIDRNMVMRLCYMTNRVYLPDLEYLRTFKFGIQDNSEIAESLYNVGLISMAGFDGGGAEEGSGGFIYAINSYGKLLIKHGFKPST